MLEGKTVNLYFLDKYGKEDLVDVGLTGDEQVHAAIDNDLARRKPGVKSYCKRYWIDNHERLWVDFGSHTEFYVGDFVEEDCEACKIE